MLDKRAGVDKKTEIDATQRVARSSGRSPANILVSTLSDEMAIHFNRRSKIFAVSVKDRGAVPMAGHTGKAFWFSKANGQFVTSSYYYKTYPAWVTAWNKKRMAFRYAGTSWRLLHKRSTYLFGNRAKRKFKLALPIFPDAFPLPYGKAGSKVFTTALTLSPAGDELTLDFAKALIVKEKLGQDDIPDYLAISFSSTDYVGHLFGPSSLESEDNFRRLDRVLADLFSFIDKTVGLDRTLIVLSSDHGTPETPDYLRSFGIAAGYIDVKGFDKTAAIYLFNETTIHPDRCEPGKGRSNRC